MQTQFSQTPPVPAAPAPPGRPVTQIGDMAGVPRTVQELVGLRAKRSELSNQLQSAASRRRNLAEQLETADPGARTGLLQRIEVLDGRIVQLEHDIAQTGRLLTATPDVVVGMEQQQERGDVPDEAFVVASVFTGIAMMVLAFGLSRYLWRRASSPARPSALPADATQRLERIEQAVEAVAIEVERVSEGQRFVTKLLSEANALPALRAGTAKEHANP